jgi:class 3 adenylate cyclase
MESGTRVVLFCDIHCFARLARALGDALPPFIQSFYELAGEVIVARGGRVLKYIGDSVLAVFPEGAEESAVRSALAMRAEFPRIVPPTAADIGAVLEVAVGSGPVWHGVVGHESLRMEDIFGETVNETAILSHTQGVAITEAVHRAIASRFRTERQPAVTPKWRQEPLEWWTVVETAR